MTDGTDEKKPTYAELEDRLKETEAYIKAIRSEEVDAIVGRQSVFLVRLKEMEDALKEARDTLEKRVVERTTELEKVCRQRDYLSRRLVNLLENEREMIGDALHDHVGQIIAGAHLQLGSMAGLRLEDGSVLEDRIEPVLSLMRETMNHLRSMAYSLRSQTLGRFGLVRTINSMVDEIRRNSHLNIKFFTQNVPDDLAKEKELTIYRVIQEALANVLKHANAHEVQVNLISRDGQIHLSVEDDGVGFDYEALDKEGEGPDHYLGIVVMRERVSLFGGEFHIETDPGQGSYLYAHLPIQNGNGIQPAPD